MHSLVPTQEAPAQPRHNNVTVEEVDDQEEFTTRASRPTVEEPDEGAHGPPQGALICVSCAFLR